jgi:hypothetical protein
VPGGQHPVDQGEAVNLAHRGDEASRVAQRFVVLISNVARSWRDTSVEPLDAVLVFFAQGVRPPLPNRPPPAARSTPGMLATRQLA